jgi:YD repeat-containing protein
VVVTVGGNSSNGAVFTVNSQTGTGQITYTYDSLGRLSTVVDGSGNAATYSYDAVGNILSISRSSLGQVRIIDFSPSSGPSGSIVTINGTGFSATAVPFRPRAPQTIVFIAAMADITVEHPPTRPF